MSSLLIDPEADDRTAQQITQVAGELRSALTPLLEALAGSPPRPIRLTRGPGLDKTLASRLIQATRAESDTEFLHIVPSPTGLRMLLDSAQGLAEGRLLDATAGAVERFQDLLDAMPGGRQALDAYIGETSVAVRERREHIARQASFKAQSFLFGHYCETLVTSIFLLPSSTPGMVDTLEVHRRIGLTRVTPSTRVPLLSAHLMGDPDGPACLTSLEGDARANGAADFIIAQASSTPLPPIEVEREGAATVFVLGAGGSAGNAPARLTTAFRMLRVDTVTQSEAFNVVRIYMLHTPCHTLVREMFIADGLWPTAYMQVGFYLPSPAGTPIAAFDPGKPHYRQLNLTTRIEQLPPGLAGFDCPGISDHRATLQHALGRAAIASGNFRGWRCRMAYPVPLIEMRMALRFAGS